MSTQAQSYQQVENVTGSDIETGSYPLITNNKIVKALDSLVNTDGEWARRAIAGYNDTGYPIKVLFKNLGTIGKEFTTHDAIGWLDENGKLLIFINEKHKEAPPEAIGALLCHESIHQDRENSYREEIYGWTFEAETWIQLKEKYPHLKNISPGDVPLVDRLNLMEMLFRKGNYTPKFIEEQVRTNQSYKSLPETSPGFGK
jgi:hypothetical protein